MLHVLDQNSLLEDWEFLNLENLFFNQESRCLNFRIDTSEIENSGSSKFLGCGFPCNLSLGSQSFSVYESKSFLFQQNLEYTYMEIEAMLLSWEKAEKEWIKERNVLRQKLETNLLHYREELGKLNANIENLRKQLKFSENENHSIRKLPYDDQIQTEVKNPLKGNTIAQQEKQKKNDNTESFSNAPFHSRIASQGSLSIEDSIPLESCANQNNVSKNLIEGSHPNNFPSVEVQSENSNNHTIYSDASNDLIKTSSTVFTCTTCHTYLRHLHKQYEKLDREFSRERHRSQDLEARHLHLLCCLKNQGFSYNEAVGKICHLKNKVGSSEIFQLQKSLRRSEQKYQSESRLYKILIRQCNAALLLEIRDVAKKRLDHKCEQGRFKFTESPSTTVFSLPQMYVGKQCKKNVFSLSRELEFSVKNVSEISCAKKKSKKNLGLLNTCQKIDLNNEFSRTPLPLLNSFEESYLFKKILPRPNSLSRSLPPVSQRTINSRNSNFNQLDPIKFLSKSFSDSCNAHKLLTLNNAIPVQRSPKLNHSLSTNTHPNIAPLPLLRFKSNGSLKFSTQTQPSKMKSECCVRDFRSSSAVPTASAVVVQTATVEKGLTHLIGLKQDSTVLEKGSKHFYDSNGLLKKSPTSLQPTKTKFHESFLNINDSSHGSSSKLWSYTNYDISNSLGLSQKKSEKTPLYNSVGTNTNFRLVSDGQSSAPHTLIHDTLRVSLRKKSSESQGVVLSKSNSMLSTGSLSAFQSFQRQAASSINSRHTSVQQDKISDSQLNSLYFQLDAARDYGKSDYPDSSTQVSNSRRPNFESYSRPPLDIQRMSHRVVPSQTISRLKKISVSPYSHEKSKQGVPPQTKGWIGYALESLNLTSGVQPPRQCLSSSLREGLLNGSRHL